MPPGSAVDPLGTPVSFDFALRATVQTGRSKAGAKVAYNVALFGIGTLNLVDRIVRIFKVPVIHDCHQNAQAIPLARAGERRLFPRPDADFLLSLQVPFEPDVTHHSTVTYRRVAPTVMWHSLNV